jgi:CxxC motif-containing protein (DUF1111 family)
MRVLSLRRWRACWRWGRLSACAGLLALAPASRLGAGGVLTVDAADREAYGRIVWAAVPPEAQASVAQGRGLVRQTWVVSPSLDPGIAGLGPTYNRPACTACHARNGGGAPPDSAAEPMRSMLVRLSVPGQDAHGGPRPEPRYGDQLNEQGVPGVPGEGEAVLQWAPVPVTLADGTVPTLRRPHLSFQHLAFGPMAAAVQTSVRVAPPMVGLGLLEAVPEADLLALAEAQRRAGQGVAGQPNRVWDAVAGRTVLGRFGWKANQPSVRQQVAGALAGDMGITTPVFPTPNCPPVQTACAAWTADRHPELADGGLDAMTRYLQVLGVPARREADAPRVRRGEALFAQAGCAACHQPVLHTGRSRRCRRCRTRPSTPTPTCCCTTWGRSWPTAGPTTWPAAASGARRHCGAWACARWWTSGWACCTTAAPAIRWRRCCGTAARRRRPAPRWWVGCRGPRRAAGLPGLALGAAPRRVLA